MLNTKSCSSSCQVANTWLGDISQIKQNDQHESFVMRVYPMDIIKTMCKSIDREHAHERLHLLMI